MHKHLKIFHPDVDRYGAGGNGCPIIYEGDYALVEEDANTTQVDTSEETAPQVIQAPAKKRKPNVVRPKQEEISYIDVGSAEITTVATDASDVNQYDGEQVTPSSSSPVNNSFLPLQFRSSLEKDAPQADQANHLGPRRTIEPGASIQCGSAERHSAATIREPGAIADDQGTAQRVEPNQESSPESPPNQRAGGALQR